MIEAIQTAPKARPFRQIADNIIDFQPVSNDIDVQNIKLIINLGYKLQFDSEKYQAFMVPTPEESNTELSLTPTMKLVEPDSDLVAEFKPLVEGACRQFKENDFVARILLLRK